MRAIKLLEQEKVESTALNGAVACFLVGIGLMFFSLWSFIV
jgi:hypothetical protein